MEIKIIIDATPELKELLRALVGGGSAKAAPVEPTTTKKPKTTKVADAAPVEEPEAADDFTAEEQAAISIEEIRELVTAKSQSGKRQEIKKLLKEFGAENVSTLEKQHYVAFNARVAEL